MQEQQQRLIGRLAGKRSVAALAGLAVGVSVGVGASFAAQAQKAGTVQRLQWTGIDLKAEQVKPMRDMAVNGLGFKPLIDQPNFAVLGAPNGSVLELYGPGAMEGPWRAQGRGVGFLVDDHDIVTKNLGKNGAKPVSPLYRAPKSGEDGGDYVFRFFQAPNGHIFSISQNKGVKPGGGVVIKGP